MDAIHAAIRGLGTTAPQNLPQAIAAIMESIYQLPEAAAASVLFTLLSSPLLSSQPADSLDPASARAILAGLDKVCRRYRTLPVSCPGLLQFLSSSSDARVFRIADRTLPALFTSVAASLPAWDAAAVITNPMPVIAWKAFLRILRRAVEALAPLPQSSPPLSSPLLACPTPGPVVQPSATPAATVSAILQLLETTILTLSPNPLKGNGPETAQFCQFLRGEGRGEEASVSLDILSGRTGPTLPYTGPAPACCLHEETWLPDASAVDPVLLLRLASALSIQLASLLQDNPTTRGRAQGSIVSVPYTAATYSDLLARVATIGYYRPWFAEPIINAVLDFAVKPPLHCCVPAGTGVVLQPELHTSIRSALSQLCASPACGAYGASCNGVLARLGLPHVPFSPSGVAARAGEEGACDAVANARAREAVEDEPVTEATSALITDGGMLGSPSRKVRAWYLTSVSCVRRKAVAFVRKLALKKAFTPIHTASSYVYLTTPCPGVCV